MIDTGHLTPMRTKRKLSILTVVLIAVLSSISVGVYNAFPYKSDLKLPNSAVAFEQSQLIDTLHEDFNILQKHFQPQIFRSFCGVASSSIVISALGKPVTQHNFFDNLSGAHTRPFISVFFSGMPLAELNNFLLAYGLETRLIYASESNIGRFRKAVKKNMQNSTNFIIVNYSRKTLNQYGSGHISPIGAYDPKLDRVLILDTAEYKYPFHWLKLTDLFSAMNTFDGKKSRGYVTATVKLQIQKPD